MTQDSFPLLGVDHIHFWVNNARQAAWFYHHHFGFDIRAYSGLETGSRDQTSWLLQQQDLRFVLTAPLRPGHPMAEPIGRHGDFVRDIAFRVEDVERSFAVAVERGAEPAMAPTVFEDEHGRVVKASIRTYGDTLHSFIDRTGYRGAWEPGFRREEIKGLNLGLLEVDHCVGNVELGRMNEWVAWYEKVLGFELFISFDDQDISTDYTALMSKVMASGNHKIKFPINEPAEGLKKSQIDEYLDFFGGAGVQHVALRTDDIIQTVTRLREAGIDFLYVPQTYYDELAGRVGEIDEDVAELARLGILVDRDEDGYLLQIFTKPITDRPPLFFAII
ncbi:MAG: 4-hydroxyphenylpyruvate dioxygenase [Fimbriimonadaceae bacterium]|nr:4-hydroxyphenylpyruvate dioxygenase [Fimbriimonadaceae bacterium]